MTVDAGMTTPGKLVATLVHMDRSVVGKTAAVMGFVAVTLFVSSAVHFFGHASGRNGVFNPSHAGIAEAIIGTVLATGAAVMVQEPWRARAVGLGAVAFAIAGFGVGLSMTTRGGHAWEIAYHVVVLPILIGTFIFLLRSGRTRGARRVPAAD
jgi:hypothetical protein